MHEIITTAITHKSVLKVKTIHILYTQIPTPFLYKENIFLVQPKKQNVLIISPTW